MTNTPSQSSAWQLDGNRARLYAESLQVEVELNDPQSGVRAIVYEGRPMKWVRPLQVAFEPPVPREATPREATPREAVPRGEMLRERYVRGSDLIATYRRMPPRTARPQLYWKSIEPASHVAGVERLISLQTDILASEDEVCSQSDVSAREVWRLTDDHGFRPLELSDRSIGLLNLGDREGAFLFRLDGEDVSYVEMVFPAECDRMQVRRAGQTRWLVQLTYRLFGERLEKGVIRRSRVQGLFLPRTNDLTVATDCYLRMCSDPPPLTT